VFRDDDADQDTFDVVGHADRLHDEQRRRQEELERRRRHEQEEELRESLRAVADEIRDIFRDLRVRWSNTKPSYYYALLASFSLYNIVNKEIIL
jgi:hypothetical protein